MTRILLLFLAIIFTIQLHGQNWDWQYGKPNSFYNSHCMQVFDENHIVAVNSFGDFLKTTDGGDTWESKRILGMSTAAWPYNTAYRLYFYDEDNGWVSEGNGSILHTSDGGDTWTRQSTGLSTYASKFDFISATTGWAVSATDNEGVVLKTTDGGASWTSLDLNTSASRFYGLDFVDENTGYLLGTSTHKLLKTTDGGVTWQRMPDPDPTAPSGSFMNNLQFIDAETGFIGDQFTGLIYKTTDGGETWSSGSIAAIGTLQGFIFLNADTGYSSDDQGNVFKTTDGGASWSQLTTGYEGRTMNNISFSSEGVGYVCGYYMIKTTDGGNNWDLIGSSLENLQTVYTVDNETVYAGGSGGKILKTSDGGANWNTQTSNTSEQLNGSFFIDNATGWMVGSNGAIVKTTDEGATWAVKDSGADSELNGVSFINANDGWAVGNGGLILVTNDGGETWESQQSGTSEDLNAVTAKGASNVWAVGTAGTVLKYDGVSWATQTSDTSDELLSVTFTDENTGYAAGANYTIIKTTDGGVNWSGQNANLPFVWGAAIYAIHFSDADNGFALGNSNNLVRTIDGGETWIKQQIPSAYGYSMMFSDANNGWIVGSNNAIYKYTGGQSILFSIPASPVESFAYDTNVPAFDVSVLNGDGTVDTGFSGEITLSVATGGGAISGTLTQTASAGVVTFDDIQVSSPGSYSFKAEIAGDVYNFSNVIKASAIDVSNLAFARQSTTGIPNVAIPPFRVVAQDINGYNVGSVYPNTEVTISKVSGPGNIGGTLIKTTSWGGVTFDSVGFDTAGEYVLQVTDGTHTATSITISVGATHLSFSDVSSTPIDEDVIMPPFTVTATDKDGFIDTTFVQDITVAKVSGEGSLGGTLTKAAVKGIATFDDIAFDEGDTYIIEALSDNLISDVSEDITVQTVLSAPVLFSETSSVYNYPNPFVEGTTISFSLSKPGTTRLQIFDIRGQKIDFVDLGYLSEGENSYVWDNSSQVKPGLYYYQIESGADRYKNKMLIVR